MTEIPLTRGYRAVIDDEHADVARRYRRRVLVQPHTCCAVARLPRLYGKQRSLNRIVTMSLDYAESQAERRQPLHMRDWREKLDAFLQFNEREILQDAGRVSMDVAKALATEHYEKFNDRRLLEESQEEDEFDDVAKRIEEEGKEGKG